MLTAITRQVSPAIANCELTHLPRVAIDYELAAQQHRRYEQTLDELGCRVVSLEAEPAFPDSVFIEDVAVILDEVGILAWPGPVSRQEEVALIAPVLGTYRELRAIDPPGTLEGGDVLRIGKTIFVGLTGRTDPRGFEQFRSHVERYGYSVTPVPVSECLHLKSAVTQVGRHTLLINPRWTDRSIFRDFELLEVDPKERYAANGLLIEDRLIYPQSFPRTAERLTRHGIQLELIDLSELQKAEGAVTCCSLVFDGGIDD